MSLIVQSDGVGLALVREATLNTQPTSGWTQAQPNPGGITNFSRQNVPVERHILSGNLTPEKGEVVGYDVNPKLAFDWNRDMLDLLAEPTFRSLTKHGGNKGQSIYRPTAVTSTGYTVASLGDLTAGLLIFAEGFSTAANNGLKVVGSSSTGTEIKTSGLTAEASPPSNATVRIAGVQGAAADITMDGSGNLLATILDFTTLGLVVGQMIYVGDPTSGATYAFANTVYTGMAIISVIAAGKITLKYQTWTVGSLDAGTGKTIRILFESFIRNVPMSSADFLTSASLSMELNEPGAGAAGVTDYTYGNGLGVGDLELDIPVEGKVTATVNFVGMTMTSPSTTRSTGPSTAYAPLASTIFSTAANMPTIRLLKQSDGTTLSAEINGCKVMIKNNLKPRKQLGTAGAAGLIYGEYNPSLSMNAYVLSNDMSRAVDGNTDCYFDFLLKNSDGGFGMSFAMVKLRKGDKTYAAGTSVMLAGEMPANRDPSTGLLYSLSKFSYLP